MMLHDDTVYFCIVKSEPESLYKYYSKSPNIKDTVTMWPEGNAQKSFLEQNQQRTDQKNPEETRRVC